ncbi:hypothetical protein SORBI_3001G223900 [Sorghum bicolor]|uniref:Uncharacterized protein n=2 Tax=Sorghum bicolor TaxID=4558 RepID=A0A1B6QKB8_SORBI|nr:hypothetical protein SORBI_3001G223900 [Sorghum bicolor]
MPGMEDEVLQDYEFVVFEPTPFFSFQFVSFSLAAPMGCVLGFFFLLHFFLREQERSRRPLLKFIEEK